MSFFDEPYYLQAKLKQLAAKNELDTHDQQYTLDTLKEAIANAGLTVRGHYTAYGHTEGVNPNPYFNESEYLQAKLQQLKSVGENDLFGQAYTLDTLKAAIERIHLTSAEHYEQFGGKEILQDRHLMNPSNVFDANAYVAAKLAQLQSASNPDAAEREAWASKAVLDVAEAINAAGLSPVSHYMKYGAIEANISKIPFVQTVPSAQRVANDPLREVYNEVVPGNPPGTLDPGAPVEPPVVPPVEPPVVPPVVRPPSGGGGSNGGGDIGGGDIGGGGDGGTGSVPDPEPDGIFTYTLDKITKVLTVSTTEALNKNYSIAVNADGTATMNGHSVVLTESEIEASGVTGLDLSGVQTPADNDKYFLTTDLKDASDTFVEFTGAHGNDIVKMTREQAQAVGWTSFNAGTGNDIVRITDGLGDDIQRNFTAGPLLGVERIISTVWDTAPIIDLSHAAPTTPGDNLTLTLVPESKAFYVELTGRGVDLELINIEPGVRMQTDAATNTATLGLHNSTLSHLGLTVDGTTANATLQFHLSGTNSLRFNSNNNITKVNIAAFDSFKVGDVSHTYDTDGVSTLDFHMQYLGLTITALADFAGSLNIIGGDGADTITGGAGNDIIEGKKGADTLTGGAGTDKFIIASALYTSGAIAKSNIDRITDFVPGTDKIITTGNSGSSGAAAGLTHKIDLTGTTLDSVLATFATSNTNPTEAFHAYTFTVGGKSYVLIDNGGAGYDERTDSVVEITGIVDITKLTEADIINQ